MSKRTRYIAVFIVFALVLGTTIYITRWKNDASPSSAATGWGPPGGPGGRRGGMMVAIRVAKATVGSIDNTVDALGTVTALNTALVKAQVDGPLISIRFSEGKEVRKGDVLAEIDPRPYQALLAQAQGTLARDAALLASAKSDLARYVTLLTQDSISQQQVEDQRALVQQYEGSVKADQANVDTAKLQLSYCHITAPISGRAGLRQVDVGNIVHASDASGIVYLTDTHPIQVVFAVPSEKISEIDPRFHKGEKLKVDAIDRDGKTLLSSGKLAAIDNLVDVTTGTVKLKALFDNQDNKLFPNQFVNAHLTINTLDDQLLVPTAAIQRGTPGTYVYQIDQNKTVHIKVIKLGIGNANQTVVLSGLKPDDQVAIDGTDKLKEGAKVEVAVEPNPNVVPKRSHHRWGGANGAANGSNASDRKEGGDRAPRPVEAGGKDAAVREANPATGDSARREGAAPASDADRQHWRETHPMSDADRQRWRETHPMSDADRQRWRDAHPDGKPSDH